MDPKRLGNAMLGLNDYTTADVLNQPIRRGAILPWTEYADRSEFDPTSGLPGAFYNALMAPARAYRGEMTDDQQIPEAFNFAGNLTLGSLLSGAATSPAARDSAIAAYKAARYRGEPSAVGGLPDVDLGYGFPDVGFGANSGRMAGSSVDYMRDTLRGMPGTKTTPTNDLDLMDAYEMALMRQKQRKSMGSNSNNDGGTVY